MKTALLIIIFLIGLVKASNAQNIDSIVIHAAKASMARGPRIGISIGVITGGNSFQYNFGSTEIGKNITPTSNTIYEIGSITKTFTSMLLAQAVGDKKVSLDDDIRKYLKGDYPNLEFKGKPIQILHLANLTSGLPNNLPEKMPPFESRDKTSQLFELRRVHDAYTRSQFLTDLRQVKLTVEPGLGPAHSNTAAQLLGFLLENVYGTTYSDLLKNYITEPFEMKSTFVTVPASLEGLCAKGYNENGTLMPEIPKDAGSAGVLRSSLADMLKYAGQQLREKDKRVVLCHNLRWGNTESFGIGLNWWLKTNFDGKRKLWASGGTFGFASYMVIYPERDFAVVLLANENDDGAEDALSGIADAVYNEMYFSAQQRASEGFGFSGSINILLEILNKNGFKNADSVARDLMQKDSSFKLSEGEMNNFGYHLLNKGGKEKALEIFKLNVNLYPESSNTYDSLAETYENLGDRTLAIKNYKRALELNPSNGNAAEHLKKLENVK